MNISHVNMGGRDQSHEKIKLKKFKKYESSPKSLPNNKNDDSTLFADSALPCKGYTMSMPKA